MNILAIETSCDETSAAVLNERLEILSSIVASQVDLHAKFGGVVPEIASRKHVELLNPVISEALGTAGIGFADVNAVAVTNRPGLVGALLVGVSAAKSLSAALSIPLIGVHHLEGHIYANFLVNPNLAFPFICLVVSGGHSDLVLVSGHGEYEILGRTRDDAAGEAFDKSARVLGLGYPGGPIIDDLAREGNPQAIKFPRSKLGDTLDFSFSGIKTAVVRYVQGSTSNVQRPTPNAQPASGGGPISRLSSLDSRLVPDICASFQAAVVDMLVDTTMEALERTGIRRVALAGGVAANSALKARMTDECAARDIELTYPPPDLCTDNAAMIACAGYFHLIRGEVDSLALDTIASQPLA